MKPAAPIDISEAAAELLSRRKATESLHSFVAQAWPQVEGGREFVDGWMIGAVCEHLEAVRLGQIKNFGANVPPRMMKSGLCNVFFPTWVWLHEPELQFLFTSYSAALTIRDNVRARRIMESNWFKTRWGDKFSLAGDQNTKLRIDNDQGGYRVTTSIDGTTTGEGADILVIDDPNPPKDTSQPMLDAALNWWTGTMPTRLNDFKTGRRIVIQQRVHESDLTGHIRKNEDKDWVWLILPMEFETNRRCVTVALPSTKGKKWHDPRTKEGELLFPERVGPKELATLKRGLANSYTIAGQLQQRPAPEAGGMFKREWFRKWKAPDSPKLEWVLTSWDTALSEKKTAAWSACTVWGVFYRHYSDEREWMQGVTPGDADALGRVPNMILLNCIRGHWEYPELRRLMSLMAKDYNCDTLGAVPGKDKKYRPDMNLVESKASGISVVQELNRTGETFTKFVPDKYGDKMQRVRMITHLIEGGRVWLPTRLDGENFKGYAKLLLDQCLLFPNAESRDIVDTLTQALLRLQYSGWIAHPEDPGTPEDMAEAETEPLY